MKAVSVSDLKAQLSRYLRIVKRGGGTLHWSATEVHYDIQAAEARAGTRQLAVSRKYALLAPTPGEITFPINRDLIGEGITATDEEVAKAVAFAFHDLKLVVEPGGAIGLAALMSGKVDVKGKVAVAVLSGGNVDADLFYRLVA